MKARIIFRSGKEFMTEIRQEENMSEYQLAMSLAQRMVSRDGYTVAEDERWGTHRWLPINLSDVESIILTK